MTGWRAIFIIPDDGVRGSCVVKQNAQFGSPFVRPLCVWQCYSQNSFLRRKILLITSNLSSSTHESKIYKWIKFVLVPKLSLNHLVWSFPPTSYKQAGLRKNIFWENAHVKIENWREPTCIKLKIRTLVELFTKRMFTFHERPGRSSF